jgi:predicted ester cyclase
VARAFRGAELPVLPRAALFPACIALIESVCRLVGTGRIDVVSGFGVESSPFRGGNMRDERERNKRVSRDLLAAADAGDVELALSFYGDDYVDHDASEARRASVEVALRRLLAAFPDAKHSIDDIVAEGTHTGEIFGIPPSGRRIRNDSLVIYRLAHGKIRERWCLERRPTRDLVVEASGLGPK